MPLVKAFSIALIVSALSAPASAQWLNHPTAGIPRTPDGKPDLSAPAPRAVDGKPDLSGLWTKISPKYSRNIAADLKASEKEDEALDLIRADAHYKTSMIQAEREFDNDPDYHTYDKRFSERSKKITDEAAGLIRNPVTREKFALHSSVSTERARDGILTKGENKKRETRFVALGDSLSTYSKIYTDPATDEATKLRKLQDMRNAVTLSERQGLLSPTQAR
jgi:hypothetical protein